MLRSNNATQPNGLVEIRFALHDAAEAALRDDRVTCRAYFEKAVAHAERFDVEAELPTFDEFFQEPTRYLGV